jgi:YcaO-like protein with predicted kinase domain
VSRLVIASLAIEVGSIIQLEFRMNAVFTDDGRKLLEQASHRIMSVEDTLSRISPLAGQFGITRVANITGLDRLGVPVAIAVRPNSKSVAVSQGKGSTLLHAKVSAMMESIEIWHAENFPGPVYYGKKQDLLENWNIVDTKRLPKQPDAEFSDTTQMLWVEGTDLFSGNSVLVPFEMIHADYTRPVAPTHGIFPASTNGLASGNSNLEATCHALAEVIERDALSLWHFADENYKRERSINPATVKEDECLQLFERIDQAGLVCGLWDITSDVGVPTMLCILRDGRERSGHIGLGSGCHPTSTVALRRAITEAAQTRLNYVSGARDDLDPAEYDEDGRMQKRSFADEELADQSHALNFNDIPSFLNQCHSEDLNLMLESLARVGISEAIWVDLGREEFAIPVARLVVPGLESPHDDDQYVTGPRARKFLDNGH